MRLAALLLALAGPVPSHAEVPLPSYERELGLEAWHRINALIERGVRLRADVMPTRSPEHNAELQAKADASFREAIAEIEAFRAVVTDTSGLAYLEGLAWRLLDEPDRAEAAWRHSVELDPEGALDAWHDLGELLIARGAWDEADAAFQHVTDHLDAGPHAWRGPLRQAEVAGWRGDAEGLEKHLHEALRRGFRLDGIRGEPQWATFLGDPRLRDTVVRIIKIYGDRSLIPALGGTETP